MTDTDQLIILYVYSLYSDEEKHEYLQYTAALVIFYYLMKKGFLPNYKEELLIYDYKECRRFLWEDKKFMNDINIVRGYDYLIRSRVQTSEYRDINAHQCTNKGKEFINKNDFMKSEAAKNITKALSSKCGKLYEVQLDDDNPKLVCSSCKSIIVVDGFLSNLHNDIQEPFDVAFL